MSKLKSIKTIYENIMVKFPDISRELFVRITLNFVSTE